MRAPRLAGLLFGSVSLCTLVTVGAQAQEAVPPGAITLQTIEVQADLSEDPFGDLEGFVAEESGSGTKTGAPLIETPQSISVVTSDQIATQGAETPSEALRYTASALTEPYGDDPRFDWVRIRGFAVNEYLDGMALPKGTYAWPRYEMYGISRAEIVRGPASVLYGSTPPGGLYNLVTKRPTQEPRGEVRLQTGDPERIQGAFDVSGPIDENGEFSYRLIGLGRLGDTQVDHVEDNRGAILPAITWQPSVSTSLTLLGYFIDDQSKSLQFLPAQGTLLPNPNGQIPRDTFIGEPDFDVFDRTQYGIGYIFEHEFDNQWQVRQKLRYSENDILLRGLRTHPALGLQGDLRTLDRVSFIFDEIADAFTVDNQLIVPFQTGPVSHEILAGIDYRRATSDYKAGNAGATPIDVYNPVYGNIPPVPAIGTSTDQTQDQIGVYLQDQIKIGRLTFLLSGRHDWLDTSTLNRIAGTTVSTDDAAFTGRAGVIYNFDNGIAPFASYSTSFQPNLTVSAAGTPFDPTTAEQFEAGVKYQPPGTNLLLTASAFDITQQDVVLFNAATAQSEQVGEIEVQGVEFEAKASLVDGLNVTAAFSYIDAVTTETNTLANLGKQVSTIPQYQASIWADYKVQSGPLRGVGFGGGVRYVGEHFGDSANTVEIPSYTLVDAMLSYDLAEIDPRFEGAEIALNATNLLDEEYVATCGDLNSCYWGPGRTIMATLSYRW